MKVEVRGVNLGAAHTSKGKFEVLCTADVSLPEMEISFSSVALSWSAERGFKALPALPKGGGGIRAVNWRQDGAGATAIAEAILAMYIKMGGKMPDAEVKPEPTCAMPVAEMGLSIDIGLARTLGVAGVAC